MRENAEQKGRRYLTEGRLTVLHVDGGRRVVAKCRGGGAIYAVGYDPAGGWRCTCPARTLCAHLVALQLVTVCTPGEAVE